MDANENDLIESQEGLSIRSLITKVTYHWPLFVISLVLALSTGYIFFRYTVPVYEMKAAIVIKDEHKGAGYNVLKELDLVDNTVVQETEMELLKSKSLVGQAIHELHLATIYLQEGRVKKSDVYDETPFNVILISGVEQFYNQGFDVKIKNKDTFVIKYSNGTSIETTFEDTCVLNQSSFKLIKNKIAQKPFAGDEIRVSFYDPDVITSVYQSRLSVGFTNKSKAVIGLKIEDENPKRGIDFLNKLIEVYNLASIDDKNQVAKNTMAFLDERLDYLSRELSLIEKEVEEYKSSRRITDISSESQLYLQSAKEKDSELSKVNFKLEILESISAYVQNSNVNQPMPATFGIDDAALQAQLTSFNVLLMERERMLATAGPQSPLLMIKDQQIQSSRKAIEENLVSLRTVFEASKKELELQSSKIESSIRMIPTIEREFISIKRQQSIKEQLYLFLLQKREEAGLTYASAVSDSRMVDTAHASPDPISPKKSLVIQLSMIIGLILPFVYIYLKDILNTKIISLDDLKKISNIPFLGEISLKSADNNVIISPESKSTVAEQFRAIRTNLHYMHGKDNGESRVTLVTSSISGEGKTFFAVNLAVSLAIAGRKVVLVELDLRKPKLSRYLKLKETSGISQYLIGIASLESALLPSGLYENFSIIQSGPIPPNPSEILMGPQMDILMKELGDRFDDIIIDTAPIGLVADAQIIARYAHASIFIIRHGYSLKSQINNIEQIFSSRKLPGMGIVFNGVDTGGRFGYGYGYGYGKDYGYYDDSKSKQKDSNIFSKAWGLLKRV